MHDEIRVCSGDGVQNLEEETDSRDDVEPMLITVLIDAFSVDKLEYEKGLAGGGDTGVDEFCDVGMGEEGENLSFTAEAAFAGLAEEGNIEEFEGDSALEPPVVAAGAPDASHSTLADVGFNAEGANDLAGKCGAGGGKFDAAVLKEFVG